MWPAIRQWWPYVDYHGLRDAFIIRYALGEQENLRMHHDVAQVSASIKLNDDYEGAALEFPRQKFSTEYVPVGDLIVWPSLVTHPHECTQLLSGVKYSLTVWCELPMAIDGQRSY
jgi:predicted 2-oxoglutarate/Fe(II)-dependent dioxygenase YbiX